MALGFSIRVTRRTLGLGGISTRRGQPLAAAERLAWTLAVVTRLADPSMVKG
jgi:hypothetical protein